MTPEDQAKLKQKLAEEIEAVTQSIASLKEASKPIAPDDSIGRLTRMDMINTRGISEANLRSAQTKLGKLERALGQSDDPDFGICVVCEEPIPLGRMLLIPESTMCVKCKQENDR